MRGTIAVDSQIDKGTTFTLTFPNAEPAGQGCLS
jgi:signal transduction histidine kinase